MQTRESIIKKLVLDNPPGRFRTWLFLGGFEYPGDEVFQAIPKKIGQQLWNALQDRKDGPSRWRVRLWYVLAKQHVPEATTKQCVAFASHKANVVWENTRNRRGKPIERRLEFPAVNQPHWAKQPESKPNETQPP